MNLVELFKKVFIPSYTDKQIKVITDENQRKIKEVSVSLKDQSKELKRDIGLNIYIATGGKR